MTSGRYPLIVAVVLNVTASIPSEVAVLVVQISV